MSSLKSARSLVVHSAIALVLSPLVLTGQERDGSPLDGENGIGVYASVVGTAVWSTDRPLPRLDTNVGFSSFTGVGTEFGVSLSRYLPDLFVRTSTFLDARITWRRVVSSARAYGSVSDESMSDGERKRRFVQETTSTADLVLVDLRFRFDTNPYAPSSAFVSIGASVGHIVSIDYATSYDPSDVGTITDYGLPPTGRVPDRRYFHSNLYLGGGYRFGTSDTANSFSIIPEFDFVIPTTSLLMDEAFGPFSLRLGLGLRFPM